MLRPVPIQISPVQTEHNTGCKLAKNNYQPWKIQTQTEITGSISI